MKEFLIPMMAVMQNTSFLGKTNPMTVNNIVSAALRVLNIRFSK